MSIARVTEISATSPESFDDAVKRGVAAANQTLRNIKSAWVKESSVRVDGGNIAEFQVNMQVTFVLDGKD